MKYFRKAAVSLLLTAAMVCGLLTPALAVWPQGFESNLYTLDGNVWVDMRTCTWTQYVDNGTPTTVYSPDGMVWFTDAGVQQYLGESVPPNWMTGTPDSTYASPDGGMLWLRDFQMGCMDWNHYWDMQLNQPMPQSTSNPTMLYRLPGSVVYWVDPLSWSVYYEPFALPSASVIGMSVHAFSTMNVGGYAVSGGDSLLFALASEPQPNSLQSEDIWLSEMGAEYNAVNQIGANWTGPLFGLYDTPMREWLEAVNTPVSFDPYMQTVSYGSFTQDPSGMTVLSTSTSPINPTDPIFRPHFLYLKAPCDCTVTLHANLYAASDIYCMLDLCDLYGYGGGAPNDPQYKIVVNNAQQGYYPLSGYGMCFTDTDGNGIIDPSEGGGMLGSYVQPTAPNMQTVQIKAGRVYRIPIFIWKEAQAMYSSLSNTAADLDIQFEFTPDRVDTAPFLCCPYDDGVAIVGIDPDYLFYNEFPIIGPFTTPYGSAYDGSTHTLTIPDTIDNMPVRAILSPNDPAVMNQNIFVDWELYPVNIMSSDYMQQKYGGWYTDHFGWASVAVNTLILPYTLRVIGDDVCGDTLQTVHVPHAAQASEYVFSRCQGMLTVCCDLPNSAVQQTMTAANMQPNITFAVCTAHSSHVHTFGSWVETTPATPTEQGEETRTCTDCGASETRQTPVIPAGYGFFSGGYGTESAPFEIANASDFDHIDDFYAAYGSNLPCNPVYFLQTANIEFYYHNANDNDGTQGYRQVGNYDPSGSSWGRSTPVSEMHNAVYNGDGHTLSLGSGSNYSFLYIEDSDYVGMFGLVTDSTICNLTVDLGYGNGLVGTGSAPSVGGVIGRAENCTLDHITVYLDEYMSRSCDLLAGSASGCAVTNCFTNGACQAPSMIGTINSNYTFSNVWAVGEGAYGAPDSDFLSHVTGVILADGMGVSTLSVQEMLSVGHSSFALVDTHGNVQQHPVQYDPDATGILYYFCPAEDVIVNAGEHGSVIGAGVYRPYSQIFLFGYDTPKVITGLTPVPDAGYEFAGWEFTPPELNGNEQRTMTLQPDGSYTYTSTYFCGGVTVTANFALHETHTFGEWNITTAATCTEAGEKTRTCSGCGFTETETILAGGHQYDAVVTDPTCLAGGYTTYTCQNCPDTYTANETDALGHDFGEWAVTTPASVEAAGVETRECNRCHITETRSIPAIPAGYGFFSGGYGTETSPFLIANATDFDHIDDFYAAYGDNLPCTPVYFTQTASINLSVPDLPAYDGTEYNVEEWMSGYCRTLTPVSVMHDAVYDGGGHELFSAIGMTCIVGGSYAGLFGQVTDCTIRNLNVFMEGVTILATAENGCAGMIARAENCLLDTIRVRLWGDAFVLSSTDSVNVGMLAGCVENCRVENCLTQTSSRDFNFIGGATADFTSRNTWWAADVASVSVDGFNPQRVRNVTGIVFAHDYCGVTLNINSQQIVIPTYTALTDAQGVVQPDTLQFDPTATGLRYHLYFADHVTFAAGEHGTLTGAGDVVLYGEHDDVKTVTGLQPIPDTGYVFTGWDICNQNYEVPYLDWINRSVTQQADGTYTYSTELRYGLGTAVVTANFAPHGTHTFGEWTITTAATCTETGVKTRTCTTCGATETETIPANGHQYDAVVTEPTCLAGGYTTYTCQNCPDTYTANETDALGHDFGEWAVTTPATTTADGVETHTCTVCGATETRPIPCLQIEPAVLVLNAPSEPVYTGDTFTVTADLTQNPGLAGMSLSLSYDPDVLTLTGAETGGMLQSGSVVSSKELSVMPYTILWDDALAHEPHTETGTILTFTFTVKDAAPAGQTTVMLTYDKASTFDKDLNAVPLTITDGELTVIKHTPGDADGDGEITLQDVANIARSLAGGWDVTVDQRNSDVNGDGVVNLKDVVLLRRYLAGGWGVELQ